MQMDTGSPQPDQPAFTMTSFTSNGEPLPLLPPQQPQYSLFKPSHSPHQPFASISSSYPATALFDSSNIGPFASSVAQSSFAGFAQSACGPVSVAHVRLESALGTNTNTNTQRSLRSKGKGKGKGRATSKSDRDVIQEAYTSNDANMNYINPHSMMMTMNHEEAKAGTDPEDATGVNLARAGALALSLSSPPSSASLANPNNSLQAAQQGVMSPPTPAPSPTPGRGGWWAPGGSVSGFASGTGGVGRQGEDGLVDSEMAAALLASAGDIGCDPTSLILAFPSLPAPTRLAFLNALLPMLSTPELLMLSSHIGPRLKRDFLRDLPQELALHCLSFVDDPRTLARAACVSKHWRKLLEDEQTWKEMCERHRFQTNPAPNLPVHALAPANVPTSPARVMLSRIPENGSDRIMIPSSTNQLPPAFGITNPEMFVPSRVMRDSGLMETDEEMAGPTLGMLQGPLAIAAHPPPPPPHLVPTGGVTSAAAQVALSGLTAAQIANPVATAGFAQIANGAIVAAMNPNVVNPITMTGVTNGQLPPLPSVVSPGAQALSASISANRIRGNSLLGLGRAFSVEPAVRSGRQRFGSISSPNKVPRWQSGFSYKMHFKKSYLTESNWLRGGRLLSSHTSADDGVVTSLAVDSQHIIIGMANSKIHIFEAGNGAFLRTLSGHELGVWCLTLISAGGGPLPDDENLSVSSEDEDDVHVGPSHSGPSFNIGSFGPFGSNSPNGTDTGSKGRAVKGLRKRNRSGQIRRASIDVPFDVTAATASRVSAANNATGRLPSLASVLENAMPATSSTQAGSRVRRMRQSDICGAARGWGQKHSIVVSGSCDRDVKVWDLETGECLHTLHGHTSTIRCLKVIDGRPIVVSGSRDATLKVWDVEKGTLVHSLAGHQHSVRCIEIAGNQVVSGSYDCTCRIWDLDTGECLQTLRGHYHQIYAVAFDGERVATGSLDSTVRIWSAATGECVALLQGHTSLVGQLQLTGDTLITGGSDGRVIIFDLVNYTCLQRICAHDNSVTCLQFDDRFIVSGGNDGRVKLWDIRTGNFIRELSKPCEAVWRVTFRDDKCAILCKRNGKTVLEVLSFVPEEI